MGMKNMAYVRDKEKKGITLMARSANCIATNIDQT